jgi:SAM-dependent methyltransferase
LIVADLQSPGFPAEFGFPNSLIGRCDKVFSNAALHWCAKDPREAIRSAWRVLAPGGRIIAEMGGEGNCAGESFCSYWTTVLDGTFSKGSRLLLTSIDAVAGIREALYTVVRKRGLDPMTLDPWYFPSMEEYTTVSYAH